MSLRPAILVAATAACLAGCAGAPLIDVQQPGFTRAQDGGDNPVTLAQARKSLFELRGAYRDAMRQQLSVTQYSSAGLVTLGAAVVGLAAGNAHKDAILGASLLGGTAYAVGNLTLDRRRVLAFDAGIRALDCAHAAVIPLDLGQIRLGALQRANATLKNTRGDLEASALALRTLAGQLRSDAQLATEVPPDLPVLLAQIDAALEGSEKTRKAAARLTEDTREIGARLQNTVNTIAARVDGFIAQTVPDLSAVPQAIAGLGGFAAAFAPGAGIDKTLAESMNRATAKLQAHSGTGEEDAKVKHLKDQMTVASERVAALSTANDEVIEQLGAVDGTAVVGALKACNVADVALPLSLEPAALTVDTKGGPGKGFAIRGGTKPYTVRWLDAAADGLSLTFAGGFSDLVQVSAKDVPAGGYRLQVSDSAGGSVQLVVTVNGAQAPSIAGSGKDGSNGSPDLGTLTKNINGLAPFTIGSTKISIGRNGADLSNDKKKIVVKLSCDPPPPAGTGPSRDEVVRKLYEEVKSPEKDLGLVELSPTPANCFKD